MSEKQPLAHLLSRFVGTPLMIHPLKFEVLVQAFGPRMGLMDGDVPKVEIDAESITKLSGKYGSKGTDRSYEVADGVAVIPVQGTLTKRATGWASLSGACTYTDIQSQLDGAVNDASVRGILLDVDSPGGESSGCFELADYIYSLRGKKPIYAVSNDGAFSAAYAIASAADKIFVTQTGGVGSIGVYALHTDQHEYDKKIGAKFTYVYAGDKKVDGNPHEPLSDRAKASIQAEVDRQYDMFVATVARNRGLDKKDVVATQAGLYWAANAVPLLADEVGTYDQAFSALQAAFGSVSNRSVSNHAASAAIPVQGEAMVNASKTEAEDEELTKSAAEGSKPEDNKQKDKESDDDMEGTENAKNAATATPIVGAAPVAPLAAVRTKEEIEAIGSLCALAGCPEKALTYATRMDGEQFMSLAAISHELTDLRNKKSEEHNVNSNVNANVNDGALSMTALEAQARQLVNTQRGQQVAMLYGQGTRTSTTPEQAMAAMLESNPEVYEAYRNKHNASALVNRLRSAGFELVAK